MSDLEPRTEPRFPHAGQYSRETGYVSGPRALELRAAIEGLYAAFADARLSDPLPVCRHCFTESDVRYLSATPLGSLSHADLGLICSKLISTLGSPDDVAYFLPRVVEGIAEGACIDLLPFAECLKKMPAGAWSPERRNALRRCFQLLFAETDGTLCDLSDEENRGALSSVLSSGV